MKNILLIIFLLSSSALFSQSDYFVVKGKIINHHPYCGGAYPSEEMAKGYNSYPTNFKMFVCEKDDSTKKILLKFTSNETGDFEFSLPKGKYNFYEIDKALSFKKFVAKSEIKENSNYKNTGIKCLKKWYKTADFTIDLYSDTTVNIIFYHRCFVKGNNPCIQYLGPYPP